MQVTGKSSAVSLIAILVFASTLIASTVPGVRSQQLRGSWKQVDLSDILPTSVHLGQVQLSDSTTAWLTGYELSGPKGESEGRVYKLEWHDGKWLLSEHYSFPYAVSYLKAEPDGSVRVVEAGYSDRGDSRQYYVQILRKDGGSWHEETGQLAGVSLGTISMLPGGQEGWAAGSIAISSCKFVCKKSYVLHFTGGSWAEENIPANIGWGIASIDFAGQAGFAVGDHVLKYAGQNWTLMDLPPLPPTPTVPPNEEMCPGLYGPCLSFTKVRVLGREEFWAFGNRYLTVSSSDAEPILLHYKESQWQVVMPSISTLGNRSAGTQLLKAETFSLGNDGFGFVAFSPIQLFGDGPFPQIIMVSPDGTLSYEQLPQIEHTSLGSISNTDANHALAIGEQNIRVITPNGPENHLDTLLFSYGYDGQTPIYQTPVMATPSLPTRAEDDKHYKDGIYFPEVRHNLRGAFFAYWKEHGGLSQFGYPLTDEFIETPPNGGMPLTVQYFERARFELHPELPEPYRVSLGLVGEELLQAKGWIP